MSIYVCVVCVTSDDMHDDKINDEHSGETWAYWQTTDNVYKNNNKQIVTNERKN